MVLAYVIPLTMIAVFFILVLFLVEWLAQIILYSYVVFLVFLPFVLLYKAEGKDEKE